VQSTTSTPPEASIPASAARFSDAIILFSLNPNAALTPRLLYV
jgi:hypothetical protein